MGVLSQEVQELQPDDEGWVEANLLSAIADGKPYVFLVADMVEDENGQSVRISTRSDILDVEVIKVVLASALSED